MSRGLAMAMAVAALAAAPGGCGGDGSQPAETQAPGERAAPSPVDPLRLPGRVPTRATGPADPAATRVIRAWTRALRRGDIARAAAYFAIPSRVQNATPTVTLSSIADARAFNVSLPCGARPVGAGGAGRFTIVTFELTERVDGDCMGAAGRRARCAIRVAHGRIVEWYRLADPEPPATIPPESSSA